MKDLIDKIREKLDGKKTYLIVIIAVVIAILQGTGTLPPELPDWVWKIIYALLGGAGRSALKKIEK